MRRLAGSHCTRDVKISDDKYGQDTDDIPCRELPHRLQNKKRHWQTRQHCARSHALCPRPAALSTYQPAEQKQYYKEQYKRDNEHERRHAARVCLGDEYGESGAS